MATTSDYLKHNSNVREELLHLRLSFELKKAAAEREYHLKIFRTNVDFEGFDLIFDDNRIIGKYQVKSRWNSTTSMLKIHRSMLFPTKRDGERMRIGDGTMCSNTEKGVILIDVKEIDNDIVLDYFYTDFYIIKGIGHGLIKKSKQAMTTAGKTMINLLGKRSRPNEKMLIGINLFVKMKNPNSLLAICGFDNSIGVNPRATFLNLFENNKIINPGIRSDSEFQNNCGTLL